MDTLIYIGAGILTVAWSVWLYLAWEDRARLAPEAGGRFFLILGPSTFFILIALAGWERALFLRLDLLGIAVLSGITLLAWLALLAAQRLSRRERFPAVFRTVLWIYNGLALLTVLLAHLVKAFPPLLIALSAWIRQSLSLDFFKFAWIGLNPETHENDLAGMLNKILIAVLSYVPISLLRGFFAVRQRRRMAEEIGLLKERLSVLEDRLKEERPGAESR